MHALPRAALALLLLAATAHPASAQAGRPIPIPSAPITGPGSRLLPFIPFIDSDGGWITVLLVGGGVVYWICRIGNRISPAQELSRDAAAAQAAADLIRSPESLASRRREVEALLEGLATRGLVPGLADLEERVRALFFRIQRAWEARDYSPVRSEIGDDLFARHSARIDQMKSSGLINRLEDLQIDRAEFVHAAFEPGRSVGVVSALITFRVRSYFVNAGSLTWNQGSREVRAFQEFWTLECGPSALVLTDICPSTDAGALIWPLAAPQAPAASSSGVYAG